jgi:PAS domain S-box-containing protein
LPEDRKSKWSEEDRLRALDSYEIVDTAPEEDFDGIVRMAAQICRVPISLISFVAADRLWFKARVGLPITELPRAGSFCSHAIQEKGLFMVPDTTEDERFRDSPVVTGAPHLRFYAGVPLETPEGIPVGTVCVLDDKPRKLTEHEVFALNSFARQVMTQLELRRALRATRKSEERFRFMAELLPQKIFTAKPTGEVDFLNRQWMEFTGLEYDEIKNWGWTKFVHPDDVEENVRRWKESLERVKPFEFEQRFRRKDGDYRWHLSRAYPMHDESGKLLMWLGSNTDIDDQRRISECLGEAAAKFGAIFDQSTTFSGIMTLDGILLEANRACLDGCGYRAADNLGKPFWEGGWWRGSKEVQDKIRHASEQAAQGIPYRAILPYHWANGAERIVEFALHPIRDESQKVIFLHPTGIDITEREEAQARARLLEQLTQKLSIVSDAEEINRIVTREVGRFLGAQRAFFFQALHEPNRVKVLPDWHETNVNSLEGEYQLSDFGTPEWWRVVQAGPVLVEDVTTSSLTKEFAENYEGIRVRSYALAPFIHDGLWVACFGVAAEHARRWTVEEKSLLENTVARVWPLIERARVESALREAQAALHSANNQLADKATHLEAVVQQRTATLRETIGELEAFSYSIAHDMRAPLRSMQGFADILVSDYADKLDADGRRFLERIAASAERMDKLIQDVLNYSGVVRRELPIEVVDVGRLLQGIVETYPMLAPSHAEVTLAGPFPPVLGNEAMLMQIFSNLMGNAVKFVAPGVKPRIKVRAEVKGSHVRFFVEDNGIGISADQHEKIFAIFQQVSKNFEGTGIGLAIVKKAVERMGGQVGLRSVPGRGSTFWVEMPLAPMTA